MSVLLLLQVDVFSFGIALWEILTGEEPYASMHCGAIIGMLLKTDPQNFRLNIINHYLVCKLQLVFVPEKFNFVTEQIL